ncbi:MAG: hypothetical protein NXI12_10415 [Alphaproteobacteria bacterium]|nr:hypothetical protein [Alphaproteobacteria bacterium]
MILQNISKAIREQNYYAVALEFIIVIAGVVIGFQISQWNEARLDRARSGQYLERLEAELYRDLDRAIDRVLAWERQAEAGGRALAFVESGSVDPEDAWPLVVSFNYAADINQFRTELATFEELRSSGRLHLISNPAIRTFLIRYSGAADTSGLRLGTEFRDVLKLELRQGTPVHVYTHIRRNCIFLFRGSDATTSRPCDPPAGLAAGDIVALLDAYRSDAALIEELRASTNTLVEATIAYRELADFLEPVVNEMRAELGMEPAMTSPNV